MSMYQSMDGDILIVIRLFWNLMNARMNNSCLLPNCHTWQTIFYSWHTIASMKSKNKSFILYIKGKGKNQPTMLYL